jgi:hypothetical protein
MNYKIRYILLAIAAITFASCQPDPEPGGTATQDVAGEWWVQYYEDDGAGNLTQLSDYLKLSTFNTAANTPDSIWISDLAHFWDIQVKVPLNYSAKTFAIEEGDNVSYASKVTIRDGKVLLGQGKSSSGVKTDSIYVKMLFDDDTTPYGTIYVAAGHRRTGFLEDEHE